MSLKLFLLMLLGLVLLTTSTLAGHDNKYPPRDQGPYKKGPPKHGPLSSGDSLSDDNLPLDGEHYKKTPPYEKKTPPYKKKPPVVETEGRGEYGGYGEPKPVPRHEPIYGDPRKGDGPKKPPHKQPPLEN